MTDRMTVSQLIAQQKAVRKGVKRVVGAKRVSIGGEDFDSALEARWWQRLCMLQNSGNIRDLTRQVPFELMGYGGPILTPTGRRMRYIADFTYTDRETGARVVADAKGFQTDVSKIKLAIMAAQGVQVRLLK